MQIRLASITVDDQEKALGFYTGKLGFVKRADIAMGPIRWLTVSSPEGADGVELLLEKMDFPPSQIYQQARFNAGIPAVAFTSSMVSGILDQTAAATQNITRGRPGDMFLRSSATRRANQSPALSLACPAPFVKIFGFSEDPNQFYISDRLIPLTRGGSRSSRTLGGDAVDADVPLTNGA